MIPVWTKNGKRSLLGLKKAKECIFLFFFQIEQLRSKVKYSPNITQKVTLLWLYIYIVAIRPLTSAVEVNFANFRKNTFFAFNKVQKETFCHFFQIKII